MKSLFSLIMGFRSTSLQHSRKNLFWRSLVSALGSLDVANILLESRTFEI